MAAFLDEILLHIFGYLDAHSLARSALVSRQWGHISKASSLWRRLVLSRWPSQRFLFEHVPATSVAWLKLYKELALRGSFSPDNMKYFVYCRVLEDELVSIDLREAMLLHMAETISKWTVLHPLDNDEENATSFNRNLELFYDTQELQWGFIDKRREYIDDLFCFKVSHKSSSTNRKTPRHIRPYQVMPSCLLMYRWLCLFRSYVTEEIGLTFYRIWRFRLKHRDSGQIFEVCDWKAAMSCSFAVGCPNPGAFKDDSLELLNLLSHPHFITHPMGVDDCVPRTLNPKPHTIGVVLSRTNSATSSLSSIGFSTPKSPIVRKDTEPKDTKVWGVVTSSMTDSDDESDGGYESGYVANCEYFISISHHLDVEEQHKSQAQVASAWMVVQNATTPHLTLFFDANEGVWNFQPASLSLGLDSGQMIGPTSDGTMPPDFPCRFGCQGGTIAPIPSCLALYRLVCLMDVSARTYASLDDASVWALHLVHSQTQSVIHLMDVNGWFDVSLTLTEDLQNQMKEESFQAADKAFWQQACAADSSCSDYVASDEDSEASEDDDMWCVTPTPNSDEVESISSTNGEDLSLEVEHRWWWASSMELAAEAGDQSMYDDDVEAGSISHASQHSDVETSNGSSIVTCPLDLLKQDVRALLNLLMDETFAHPYGTIAGSVA